MEHKHIDAIFDGYEKDYVPDKLDMMLWLVALDLPDVASCYTPEELEKEKNRRRKIVAAFFEQNGF